MSLLRKFSSATAAEKLDHRASSKKDRTRPNSSAETRWPVMVMASAYSRAARSIGEKRALSRHVGTSRTFSSSAPVCIPRDALMSIQKGQPLIRATRR